MRKRDISRRPVSLRLFVLLSVTFMYCIEMENDIKLFSAWYSTVILVS